MTVFFGTTFNGTPEGDTIFADTSSDRLYGADGDDLISGGGGNDLIIGGNGADALLGGRGSDTLVGGRGDDWLDGGKQADTYLSNSGVGDHETIIFGHDGDRWQIPNHFSFDGLDSNHDGHLGRLDDAIDWVELDGLSGLHIDFGLFEVDLVSARGLFNIGEAETFDWS